MLVGEDKNIFAMQFAKKKRIYNISLVALVYLKKNRL